MGRRRRCNSAQVHNLPSVCGAWAQMRRSPVVARGAGGDRGRRDKHHARGVTGRSAFPSTMTLTVASRVSTASGMFIPASIPERR